MIETWIDEVPKVFEISDSRFGTVRSYRVIEKAEFPLAINPAELDRSPVAVTLPATLRMEYSTGGPLIGYWAGVTELHVAPDIDKGRLPSLMPWYGKIMQAVVTHMKLNNKVELFLLSDREDAIDGPLPLKYGDEAWHWGFIVNWQVKERLEGQFSPSA